jgi:hypothetical protein
MSSWALRRKRDLVDVFAVGERCRRVSVWSGPFLWMGVRVMYPHSVMWIHSHEMTG